VPDGKNLQLLNRFRLSAAMQPYVLRVRLLGRHFDFGKDADSAVCFSRQVGKMRRILVRRGIAARDADRAVMRTLQAAVDHQLSRPRFEHSRINQDYSRRLVDRLAIELRELRDLISQLPSTSKGRLNKRVAAPLDQPAFDSELFISVVEIMEEGLREVSPRRLAIDALSKIRPEGVEDRTPPIISLWEALPALTRSEVERLMQGNHAKSLIAWLRRLADLLEQNRPEAKIGAPHSLLQPFLRRVRPIWIELGLEAGLAFDFSLHPATEDRIGRGGRVESGFQSYCHAALTAFGDVSKISARQVVNAKGGTPETKLPVGPEGA